MTAIECQGEAGFQIMQEGASVVMFAKDDASGFLADLRFAPCEADRIGRALIAAAHAASDARDQAQAGEAS
jgi:hypothetical protein